MTDLRHICFEGAEQLARSPRKQVTVVLPRPVWARPAAPSENENEPTDPLIAFLLGRSGLDDGAYRPRALRRRLPALLRFLRVPDSELGRRQLERNPALIAGALSTLLIGVTEFFRDEAVFEYLRRGVLAELFARCGRLRVCSAGSSAGHELYSVAMLLAEAELLDRCELTGLDCRGEAVSRASDGVFSEEDIAGLDARRRERFFRREGCGWRASPELRRRMNWQRQDLFALGEGGPWDVILFRNVAIYFDETRGRRLWQALVGRLSTGGLLVTGKAEKPPAELHLARLAPCVYRKPDLS